MMRLVTLLHDLQQQPANSRCTMLLLLTDKPIDYATSGSFISAATILRNTYFIE